RRLRGNSDAQGNEGGLCAPCGDGLGGADGVDGGARFSGDRVTDMQHGRHGLRASNSTAVQSVAAGNCGTVGVRGYYTHVGGASWTMWTTKTGSDDTARRTGTNFTQAQHYGQGTGTFTTNV